MAKHNWLTNAPTEWNVLKTNTKWIEEVSLSLRNCKKLSNNYKSILGNQGAFFLERRELKRKRKLENVQDCSSEVKNNIEHRLTNWERWSAQNDADYSIGRKWEKKQNYDYVGKRKIRKTKKLRSKISNDIENLRLNWNRVLNIT